MSSVPEYLGTTKIYSYADKVWRTWHVWASYEPDGELTAIHYFNVYSITTSWGPITKKDCDSNLKRALWRFAEESLAKDLLVENADDFAPNSNVMPFKR